MPKDYIYHNVKCLSCGHTSRKKFHLLKDDYFNDIRDIILINKKTKERVYGWLYLDELKEHIWSVPTFVYYLIDENHNCYDFRIDNKFSNKYHIYVRRFDE